MGLVESILLAVVTSATVGGVLVFAIKHYLQRAIDLRFKPLEHQLQLEFEQRKKLSEMLVERQIGIYPELLEIVYRLRKCFETGIDSESAILWDQDIPVLAHRLYEILFNARAFLPNKVFNDLHQYKRLCQDVVQILDVLTREDNIKNRELYQARLPELVIKVRRAQELYPGIQAALSFRAEAAP